MYFESFSKKCCWIYICVQFEADILKDVVLMKRKTVLRKRLYIERKTVLRKHRIKKNHVIEIRFIVAHPGSSEPV